MSGHPPPSWLEAGLFFTKRPILSPAAAFVKERLIAPQAKPPPTGAATWLQAVRPSSFSHCVASPPPEMSMMAAVTVSSPSSPLNLFATTAAPTTKALPWALRLALTTALPPEPASNKAGALLAQSRFGFVLPLGSKRGPRRAPGLKSRPNPRRASDLPCKKLCPPRIHRCLPSSLADAAIPRVRRHRHNAIPAGHCLPKCC